MVRVGSKLGREGQRPGWENREKEW